jgi:hypothetical protein
MDYYQGLLASFRQGYVDAGGPDFEDSDAPVLTRFREQGVASNAQAYALGERDAARDRATGAMDNPTPGWVIGTPIPADVPIGSTPRRDDAETIALWQRSTGAAPSPATSGPPGPFGYASSPEASGYLRRGATSTIFGLDPMLVGLLVVAAGVAYYLTRR